MVISPTASYQGAEPLALDQGTGGPDGAPIRNYRDLSAASSRGVSVKPPTFAGPGPLQADVPGHGR